MKTPTEWIALFAALAALASAIAAWQSRRIAKENATHARDAAHAAAMRELVALIANLETEASRVETLCTLVRGHEDALANFAGAFNGSGHAGQIQRVESYRSRAESWTTQAAAMQERLPALRKGATLDVTEPIERLAPMVHSARAAREELDGRTLTNAHRLIRARADAAARDRDAIADSRANSDRA